MPKPRFKTRDFALKLMGRLVRVSKVMERVVESGAKHGHTAFVIWKGWEVREIEPRTGWVTGFRYLQVGTQGPGDDSGSPAEWNTESVIPVLLVAFWPNEKPWRVPLDGYEGPLVDGLRFDRKTLAANVSPTPCPSAEYGCGKAREESIEAQREFMRDVVKTMKRDERGRFLKGVVG